MSFNILNKYSLILLFSLFSSLSTKAQTSELINLSEIKNTPDLYFNTGINVDTLDYCRPQVNGFYGHYYIRHKRYRYTLGKMDVFVEGVPQEWKFTESDKETFLFIELNEPGLALFKEFDIGSAYQEVLRILTEEYKSIDASQNEIHINDPDFEINLFFEESKLKRLTIKAKCK